MTKIAQHLLYWLAYIPIRFILRIKTDQSFTASDLRHQSYILVANHVSRLDTLFLLALPWELYKKLTPIYFLTDQKEFNKPWLAPFLHLLGAYPLPHNKWTLEQYFAQTIQKVTNGNNVMIFPEGEVQAKLDPLEVSPGLGYLISRTTAPVIPVRIRITSFGYKSFFTKKNNVQLTLKKPLSLNVDNTENGLDIYREISRDVFSKV